jgi:hypothetical protein
MNARLVPTPFSQIQPGDVVIGRCGRERVVLRVQPGPYAGSVHVSFRAGGQPWTRSENDSALKVVRE